MILFHDGLINKVEKNKNVMYFVMFWITLVLLWRKNFWKTYKIKFNFGVYAFQDPLLCSSTIKILWRQHLIDTSIN